MSVVICIAFLACLALPGILDGPTRRRRRKGITVYDEMWARGEITAAERTEMNEWRPPRSRKS